MSSEHSLSEEPSFPVHLYVYDLSKGMAKQLSQSLLGIPLEGVWHTSVVVNGVEYFYGRGIQTSLPAQTHHGYPQEVITMGRTSIPKEVITEYLSDIHQEFTAEKYNLFDHNCNNFSHQMCEFLVGKGIPSHITDLPQTVLNTPFGQMLRPMLEPAFASVTQ